MSKSIFAACEAPAPAFRQADLPIVPNRLAIAGRRLFLAGTQPLRHKYTPPTPAKAEMFN